MNPAGIFAYYDVDGHTSAVMVKHGDDLIRIGNITYRMEISGENILLTKIETVTNHADKVDNIRDNIEREFKCRVKDVELLKNELHKIVEELQTEDDHKALLQDIKERGGLVLQHNKSIQKMYENRGARDINSEQIKTTRTSLITPGKPTMFGTYIVIWTMMNGEVLPDPTTVKTETTPMVKKEVILPDTSDIAHEIRRFLRIGHPKCHHCGSTGHETPRHDQYQRQNWYYDDSD